MSEPKRSEETLKIFRYEHGGSRIYFEDGDDRELVADTYQEKDREVIFEAIRATVAPAPAQSREEEALAAIEKAREEVHALCNGKRWIMSVPARESEDPDLIIATALRKAEDALRSRQSPQAADDRAIDLLGEIMSYDNYRAFPPNLRERIDEFMADAEMEGMQSCGPDGPEGHDAIPAALQPPPQGEDALRALAVELVGEPPYPDGWVENAMLKIKKYTEARLASFDASARELRYALTVIAQAIRDEKGGRPMSRRLVTVERALRLVDAALERKEGE